ncbi:MAG: hypothetical protein FWD23_14430, partial [Oscillospiraceae bacterium]|nr:hypothetical protein [Oscillospiraceae bacterium]
PVRAGKKKKAQREPDIFDLPEDSEEEIFPVPAPISQKEPEIPEIPPAGAEEPVEDLDLEEEPEAGFAPVALYDAPPQILFDNDERTNLWEDPSVPKNGWACVDVIDLGRPVGECGMCGKEDIRYVHIMRHENHQSIGVGCVCAGKMEGSAQAAKERENSLKNKINRFKTFSVTEFKTSAKGNLYTKYKDTVITFMQTKKDGGGWNYVENGEFSPYFKTLDDAKRAAFEKIDSGRDKT